MKPNQHVRVSQYSSRALLLYSPENLWSNIMLGLVENITCGSGGDCMMQTDGSDPLPARTGVKTADPLKTETVWRH